MWKTVYYSIQISLNTIWWDYQLFYFLQVCCNIPGRLCYYHPSSLWKSRKYPLPDKSTLYNEAQRIMWSSFCRHAWACLQLFALSSFYSNSWFARRQKLNVVCRHVQDIGRLTTRLLIWGRTATHLQARKGTGRDYQNCYCFILNNLKWVSVLKIQVTFSNPCI